MELRRLMTKMIANSGWMDYAYERGDYDARKFGDYSAWLASLDDSNFLDAYNRVRDFEHDLD